MPKARKSSSRRRMNRFEEKYSHTVIPLRIKRYLPRMNTLLETELTIHDALEVAVFAELTVKGVPSEEWPFYTAFSKRVLRAYRMGADSEAQTLRQEFILRGLDPTVLDQLIPICRSIADMV